MTSAKPWVLVGCGRMGSALLKGWGAGAVVVEPSNPACLPDIEAAGAITPELVVFAVKPQQMAEVLPAYKRFAGSATFLSIAAGKTIAGFEAALGHQAAIVRCMPNTPAAIGKGITVAVANKNVTNAGKALADKALRAGGMVEWVEDENLLDAVTALSGSGPAYVFHLVEAMAKAGAAMGLEPALAMKLARQTVIGSGHLLEQSPHEPAGKLREAVTSPGGTTAAALAVLMGDEKLQKLMTEALKAAQARGRELAG